MKDNMKESINAREILNSLSTYQKARLLTGIGSWHTYDCEGKLYAVTMSDGPHGLRKQDFEDFSDINNSNVATCFPTASAIASSWSTESVARMAKAIAREAKSENVDIVLGCGTNIKRSPLCGRNFEYFSEDSYLAGALAGTYIKAMEDEGVGTSLKHYACNNQETRRQTMNSIVDERTLHEIYLQAFETATRFGKPTTIMGSYNRLNGEYVCASKKMLTDILRDRWGFKGSVISDWGATMDIVKCIKAGMNLEMPDSYGFHTKNVVDAVNNDELTMDELDAAALNIIELALLAQSRHESSTRYIPTEYSPVDYNQQHHIARELECDSAVLLKNEGILPINERSRIIVIGEMAEIMRIQGGGSSHITTIPTMNAIEALSKKGYKVTYIKGYRQNTEKVDLNLEQAALDAVKDAATDTVDEDFSTTVLYFCGLTDRFEGEGYDRTTLDFPKNQSSLLQKLAKITNNIAVISFGGAPYDMSYADDVNAILHMYLGGQAVGEAVADLVSGDVNPSGKLAETFPFSLEDIPSNNFTYDMISNELTRNDFPYNEGIFVGYRYYQTYNKPVRYSFGYGLSYTTFEYSNLVISNGPRADDDIDPHRVYDHSLTSDTDLNINVCFTVKNTGTYTGKEIAELYITNPNRRPSITLRGFKKIDLEPGESKRVCIHLNSRSFSIYDTSSENFVVSSGEYKIAIGAAINDLRLISDYHVDGVTPHNHDRISQPSNTCHEQFTIYDSFEDVCAQSILGRIFHGGIMCALAIMNHGQSRDDPGYKMIRHGLDEAPLDSLIATSGGIIKPNINEFLVLCAHKRSFKGIAALFSSNKKRLCPEEYIRRKENKKRKKVS